ncbi:hypothetical protein ACFVVL_27085 [Kitasatospora sp. NPDC058115]|uniref:hypothetical protein n=1 Tax=Kitasatospora sp. NPDC058115 TaxID=3346347 RepID=UPI0036D88BD1
MDAPARAGHSSGGMFLLSVPAPEGRLAGAALVSSAPHAGRRRPFADRAAAHPLPALDEAAAAHAREPDDATPR